MDTFWLWTALAFAAVAGYAVIVWRRSRKRDRFRARLTLLFLAFALLPSAVVIFVLSNVLSRSVETFFLPGVEPALNEALQAIQAQIVRDDRQWIHSFEQHGLDVAHRDTLLLWLATFENRWHLVCGDSATAVPLLQKAQSFPNNLASFRQNVVSSSGLARVFGFRSRDGRLWLACRRYPTATAHALTTVQQTLHVYGTLALLREGVLRQQLIWAFGAALVLSLAVAAVLAARTISKAVAEPIAQLSAAMARVSKGDLNTHVAVRGHDELASLADTFNKMIEELRVNRERLAHAERVAAWREVARQVSHEMRNALSPTQLTLHRLRQRIGKGVSDTVQIRELISSAERQLGMLTRMAEAFSQLARMPEPTFQSVDLNALVRDVAALYQAQSHRIRLLVDLDKSEPTVRADPDRLRQVLNNLIRNAAEASEQQGEIAIKTRVDHSHARVRLTVQDWGIGMDRETLARVFKPYFSTKPSGTGLGLFIVKRIVEEHRGEIRIESKPGEGTRVQISLPLRNRIP